jgi:mono/diheme cytochrome c family protein
MSTMRLAHFENQAQAEPARKFLLESGIKARIHAESGVAKLWFVSRYQAGVRLEVPGQETARSLKLLGQGDTPSEILRDAVRCPECHSLRVDYPQFTRKSVLTNLVMGLLAEIHFLERNYYCEDCHFMWPKPTGKLPRVRRHLAPDFFLEDLDSSANGGSRKPESPAFAATEPMRLDLRQRWRRTLALILPLHLCLLSTSDTHPANAEPAVMYARTATRPPASRGSLSERPTYLRDVLPILMGKCGRCHNDQTSFLQNWLDYSVASQKRWEIKRRVWDSWHGDYFKQPMPTGNSPESQAITDEERATIRNWVESGAEFGVAPPEGSAESKAERIEAGKRLFASICAACHQPGGQGIPGRFPPLARSDFLNSDKHRAIKIVINGFQGEVVVNGQSFNNSMPKFPLTDRDIASALTYVYNSFGNSGKDVTAEEVRTARGEKNDLPLAHNASPSQEKSPFE